MKLLKTIKEISSLPHLVISLDKSKEGINVFRSFTKKHPRFLVVKNKSIGIALVQTKNFKTGEEYLKNVGGKNSAAYYSRRALKKGYQFRTIDPGQYQDAIMEINSSSSERQGKDMDESYKKQLNYPTNKNNLYFGVFKDNTLVAYMWVIRTGDLAIMNRLLGHANHLDAGIMYLMVTETIQHCIQELSQVRYVMYDTLLGAGKGLKLFKTRCGFQPYRVTWKSEL